MPTQRGKIAIVTGANAGIGFPTALELARHGAFVVLACRNEKKGKDAETQIQDELANDPEAGRVDFRQLDVSSLASVRAFADGFKATHTRLDLLINNAGVMGEHYATSADGYELQFATNYLGHFALTAQLMPLLRKSGHARVVAITSMIHSRAVFELDELMTPADKYDEMTVYAKTKLYNLLFVAELNRRLQAQQITNVIATAAHPGFTATNIAAYRVERANRFLKLLMDIAKASPLVQTPEMGALPTLYAATAADVQADGYFSPRGLFRVAGHPARDRPGENVSSEESARKLWEESERLANLQFDI
jgi:NAD(P)-dependent dehydrogenase (short-subunit alcohol dehydrogenase family)